MILDRNKNEPRNVTIADIAARLKLDKSSVSLALRGSKKISRKTRERVAEAARKMGYRPNLAARQLATAKPQIVALVLPVSFAPLASQAATATIRSMARQAAATGVIFSVVSSDHFLQAFEAGAAMALEPDGVLVWGDVPADVAAQIAKRVGRVVVVDPSAPSYSAYRGTIVGVDNEDGARRITGHLIEQGAKHLLFVMSDRDHLGQQQRWKSAQAFWNKKNPADTLSFYHKEELTCGFLKNFVQQDSAAIFCSNDMCALEVWHRLQRLGIDVPEQVILAGFDSEPASGLIGLTSAIFDGDELGRMAFEVLMRALNGEKAESRRHLAAVRICEGRTTRKQPEQEGK